MKTSNNSKSALKWIVKILKQSRVPFQITGGLAAIAYGVKRPLADIDIDIPEEHFETIKKQISPYITFGPKRFKNKLWDLYLVTLNYKSQMIDLSGSNTLQIFNKKTGRWQKIPADFSKSNLVKIFDLAVPVINQADLLHYKKILNRKVDQIDIGQIELMGSNLDK